MAEVGIFGGKWLKMPMLRVVCVRVLNFVWSGWRFVFCH